MYTLRELADAVGGTVRGDPDTPVRGFCSLDAPQADCIAYVERAKDSPKVNGKLAAVVTSAELAAAHGNAIVVANPKLAFAQIVRQFHPEAAVQPGVHDTAAVCPSAQIDPTATVGPLAAIGQNVRIGAHTQIHPGVVINDGSVIGADCELGPGVAVYHGVRIGDRVRIHAGTVVGSPGFGHVSSSEGHQRFPQVGGVVIEDDVEIGANCCIDRASLDDTVIHRGTKIDNLVQVAHGVSIGEHGMIAAQTGISGGTKLGDWVVVGGQAGFQGHISVGDHSIVAAQSGVFSDLPAKSKVSGYPAKPHTQSLRVLALTQRLPELLDRVRSLEIELELMRGELQSRREQRTDSELPKGKA